MDKVKAFYLKINREQPYTIKNLSYWLQIVALFPDYKKYILCDNDGLAEKVQREINVDWRDIAFIQSEREAEELNYIIQNVANERWKNAGLAHLTTFYHAKKNGVSQFWNIDADDTVFCVTKEKVAEILNTVEDYAMKDEQFGVIGLDMWYTFTKALHWSFGITYTNMDFDWFKVMKEHATDSVFKSNYDKRIQPQNIDGYFSYLRDFVLDKQYLKTFCVNNLRFIHYADDFFKRPISSGMFKWQDDFLILSILAYCFEDETCGKIRIPEDVVKFEINLNIDDFRAAMDLYPSENLIEKREWLNGFR